MAGRKKVADKVVVKAIKDFGLSRAAQFLKMNRRTIERRRLRLEKKLGQPIASPRPPCAPYRYHYIVQQQIAPYRKPLSVPNGVVVVGGDAHYWPGHVPFMHRAFCQIIQRYREAKTLRAVIANGDMQDFPRLSRWPAIDWEEQPDPVKEIESGQERMHEIEVAAGKVPKYWPGGNHDLRFNNWIAAHGEKLKGIKGVHLKDHFPNWEPCWSVLINEEFGFKGATSVTHRISGGRFAIVNNINKTCTHVITNHLHAANVWMETKLPGTLYGVDPGCLADINGPQFLYLEDNPVSWREGFVVLQYNDGALLCPQLVLRHPDKPDCILFKGETIEVGGERANQISSRFRTVGRRRTRRRMGQSRRRRKA